MSESNISSVETQNTASHDTEIEAGFDLLDVLVLLLENLRLIVFTALAAGLIAYGVAFLLPPTYTAQLTLLPPQPQQSGVNSALASVGALTGLVGRGALPAIKEPMDQYVALLQSNAVADRIIEKFNLFAVYKAKLRIDVRTTLAGSVRINAGKKTGLITIEVDDRDPERAAAMANNYVDALRHLTNSMEMTEAQKRRRFFEAEMTKAKANLTQAQIALESSGFSQGALNTDPSKAAAIYAQLKTAETTAEVRLGALRQRLSEATPEVQQAESELSQLRLQLQKAQRTFDSNGTRNSDYVTRYREFKHQETLLEMFTRQYELARIEESHEGTLIQVIDPATTPERRSAPKRLKIAASTTVIAGLMLSLLVLVRHGLKAAGKSPHTAGKLSRLKAALPFCR